MGVNLISKLDAAGIDNFTKLETNISSIVLKDKETIAYLHGVIRLFD